jgi:ATP-dependent RNA helicase DeaD
MGFEQLNLRPELVKVIQRLGFKEPTPIQAKCIPVLKAGQDVVGQSLTGSGKTAAFGFPILDKIVPGKGIQALVLTPTRELCVQVTDNLSDYSQFIHLNITSVFGGVGINPQIDALRTADIVVGTPGRILDHLQRKTINLRNVQFMVLDEADRMFDMGFIEDVEKILSQTPKTRQTMLFSATMPTEILNLVQRHLRNPAVIKEKIFVDQSLLKQSYFDVPTYDKFSLLVHLLKKKTSGLAIVFCGTKREVDVITRNLKLQGLKVMAVHGGLSQNRRLEAVDSLKKSEIPILVATDVAARGLDIRGISHIYNYDVPKTAEDYTHRIGRTARAGEKGSAIIILAERDHDTFRRIVWEGNLNIPRENLPNFERVRFNTEQVRERRFGRGMPRGEGGFSRGGPRQGGRPQGGARPGGGYRPRGDRPQGGARPSYGQRPRHSGGGGGGFGSRESRPERDKYRPPRFGSAG